MSTDEKLGLELLRLHRALLKQWLAGELIFGPHGWMARALSYHAKRQYSSLRKSLAEARSFLKENKK